MPTDPSYARCPKCGSTNAQKIGYTWWGGALGPKLLNYVKCGACGTAYNGKTGRSNTGGIIAYFVVMLVIFLILGYVLLKLW
jgi:uncharacterized protein (DUF983 family)